MSNSGSNPKILISENDNSTALKPKKKTTDVNIQTRLEQSANTSPIVGFGPASFDPVTESLDQELPECKVFMFFILNFLISSYRNKDTFVMKFKLGECIFCIFIVGELVLNFSTGVDVR